MHVSVSQGAAELALSSRQLRRQAASGRVAAHRYGRGYVIAERQLQVMHRTTHRGRPWNDRTKRAALDLLATGATVELSGSDRSRLKQRLRSVAVNVLAGQILAGRASLRRAISTDDTRRHLPTIIGELGLSSSGGLGVLVAPDPTLAARRARLGVDDSGDVVVVEGDARHTRVLEALALYAYGDARESAAAADWLSRAQAAL